MIAVPIQSLFAARRPARDDRTIGPRGAEQPRPWLVKGKGAWSAALQCRSAAPAVLAGSLLEAATSPISGAQLQISDVIVDE